MDDQQGTARQVRRRWRAPRPALVLVHLVLGVLGLINVYPFVWMVGTSLKSTSEASTDRHVPVPLPKYQVVDGQVPPIPYELESYLLRALVASRAPDAGPLTAAAVARREGMDAGVAATQLDGLVKRGLLARRDDAYVATAETIAAIPDGLGEGQVLALATLLHADADHRQEVQTFVPARITVKEYAGSYAHGSHETAARELQALEQRGMLSRVLVESENYLIVWRDQGFLLHFLTSCVLTISVVTVVVLTSSMLGYAIARLSFPGKMWVITLLIIGVVAPKEAVLVPIFRLIQGMGLLHGLWGMILWMSGVGIGNAFMMAGFFHGQPKEVEEAARVDGAGTFRIFFDIALPMARPIVATVALFACLGAWNDFQVPLLCTTSQPLLQPLSVAVFEFKGGHAGLWGQVNAATALMIVPVIVLFAFLSKHIVKSISAGAVKG